MTKKHLNTIQEIEKEMKRIWNKMWKDWEHFDKDKYTSRIEMINFYKRILEENYKRLKAAYKGELNDRY